MGTDQQVSQAVLLLGYGGGSVAERLLREVLLAHAQYAHQADDAGSPAHHAGVGAVYALRDGKLVLLRTKPIDVTGAMPESYLRVLRQAVERVGKTAPGMSRRRQSSSSDCGWAICSMWRKESPPASPKEAGWAAALEGAFRETAEKKWTGKRWRRRAALHCGQWKHEEKSCAKQRRYWTRKTASRINKRGKRT